MQLSGKKENLLRGSVACGGLNNSSNETQKTYQKTGKGFGQSVSLNIFRAFVNFFECLYVLLKLEAPSFRAV
jgi:hypothetical protein